jgi:mannan endo-1,4-beta-mannosidase
VAEENFVMRIATTVGVHVAIAWSLSVWPAFGDTFVRADGTQLVYQGRPYRAIGVNVPHLSQAYMGTWHHWKSVYGSQESMRRAMFEAVRDAGRHHVAFIRFFAWPGYPKGTAELYGRDKEAYWRQMDELFELCREHELMLVPCLGALFNWNLNFGEPRKAVLDTQSSTRAAVYGYVREFVTRYRHDPIILMWELENEAFLASDVNLHGHAAPGKGIYPEGHTAFRETYSLDDSFRFDELVQFYRDITAFIKELDPHHLVTSGDAGVRRESQCRRDTFPDFRWRHDTLREHLSNLLESQPEPLDVLSLHAYGNFTDATEVNGMTSLDLLVASAQAAHAARLPVFVGELGQLAPDLRGDPESQWMRAAIDVLDEQGVALIALWAWHFRWHEGTHNIARGERYPLLMQRVADFNRQQSQFAVEPSAVEGDGVKRTEGSHSP